MFYFSLIISIILSGASLAMDAFAVSICDGMIYNNLNRRKAVTIPLTFGVFQAAMPIIGFYLGLLFIDKIEAFDHWVAFTILIFIGGKMIIDGCTDLKKPPEDVVPKSYSYPEVLVQGVATSIDALAVGFSLNTMLSGVSNVQCWAWLSVTIIGLTTFLIAGAGLIVGMKVGKLFRKKACIAEIIGGVVLILIAVKIVIEAYI